jgi:hypothetical protein
LGQCSGLLGATLNNITLDLYGNTAPIIGFDTQEAVAAVAAQQLLQGDA